MKTGVVKKSKDERRTWIVQRKKTNKIKQFEITRTILIVCEQYFTFLTERIHFPKDLKKNIVFH